MQWIVGIDEVGRGPLAGPIAVGAVLMPMEIHIWEEWEGLRDSKKLSENKREVWAQRVEEDSRLRAAVAMVSAEEIDAGGIAAAARCAAAEALGALCSSATETRVLLDYGLSVPEGWQQEAFVKGDEKHPAIALASIVAKVARDQLMVEMATEHPHYGFEKHKGYGTQAHLDAIRAHGMCPLHRRTFIHI